MIHIYPVDTKNRTTHRTDKTGQCWCNPKPKQVCSEADEYGACWTDCWRCQGASVVDPYDESLPVLLMHEHGQFIDGVILK